MNARPLVTVVALALAALSLSGCLQRRMVLRSNPSGALVLIDDQQIEQRTPATVPFTWDGTRGVTLVATGHKVLDAEAVLEPRWYDYFPLDFVAEFLWPLTIVDERTFDFELEAYAEGVDPNAEARVRELLDRAAAFRAGGSDGPGAVPASSEKAEPVPPPPGK
jgi:hypothetical protein